MASPFDFKPEGLRRWMENNTPVESKVINIKEERKYKDDDGIMYTFINELENGHLRVRRDMDDSIFVFDPSDLDEV